MYTLIIHFTLIVNNIGMTAYKELKRSASEQERSGREDALITTEKSVNTLDFSRALCYTFWSGGYRKDIYHEKKRYK